MRNKLVCVSGGFDPVHAGHLRYIQEAAEYGDVVVILNTDEWLKRKKGYVFMPFEQRKAILEEFKSVKHVVKAKDGDNTVCKSLADIKPDYFAKGGDRTKENTPEQETCGHLGIEMLWGIGGENKLASSSVLVADSWDSLMGHLG